MKQSRQDLPKIIGLSIMLAAVIVYIIVTFLKISTQQQVRMEQARLTQEQAARSATTTPGDSDPNARAAASVQALLTPVPAPERDPFYPLISQRRPGELAQKPAATQEREGEGLPEILPPFPGTESSGASARDTLHVTGIVMGRPPVAVLRHGENHLIVQPGDVIDGGLRVQSINRTSVTLRGGQKTYLLRLGA